MGQSSAPLAARGAGCYDCASRILPERRPKPPTAHRERGPVHEEVSPMAKLLRPSNLLRLLTLAALLGLLTPAVAAAQAPKVETIAVVTPASRTNLGWDQQAADGIEAAAKELGIEALVQ